MAGETTFLIFLFCFFMLMINEIHNRELRRQVFFLMAAVVVVVEEGKL